MKHWTLIILFLICINSFSDTNKIHQLQTQINYLKNELVSDQNQQNSLQNNLQQIEINISEMSFKLQKIHQEYLEQKKQLDQLTLQQQKFERQETAEKNLLSQQIRALYMSNHQPYLKVIFNQNDPQQMQRMLMYYHYINKKRLALIKEINATLKKIATNRSLIQHHTLYLSELEKKQQQEKFTLENNQIQRKKILLDLGAGIKDKNKQLNTLIANKIALERVVDQVKSNRLYNFFIHLGKFPWPTPGKIIQHYDSQILGSQLHTNSILIAAPEGQSVDAIAAGHVVYAKWLAGYGLLMIIDHGNGFLSLYGRNQSLDKKLGEYVKAGEKIATVGISGGFQTPALYFALRRNGQAINPEVWCR